ncbi:hypothetical protein BKA64DRAFT_359488 [Cadophora sp. MPI-SDFR-AT-0126]|nr:hypothetical protein BKA64DRAFT_359488 [Leotiomycetes sp. MPI-SDFR-AT-0126]
MMPNIPCCPIISQKLAPTVSIALFVSWALSLQEPPFLFLRQKIAVMAEILGVVAGATQLAQYALKISAAISEVHDRVRSSTEFREHKARIQRLIDTTAEIKRHPQTCNYAVLQHLKSATEEANHLLDLLQRLLTEYTCGSLGKRYLKAVRGGKYEKKIATSFQRLEQEKTSLIFCIGMGNTEQLHYISEDVKRIAEATDINMSIQADHVRVKCIEQGHEGLVPKEMQYTFSCKYEAPPLNMN